MIQAVRQVFGRAAVPLVESNRVETGGERLVGQATHVVRVAGAFEAVKRDERGMVAGSRLPVAVGEHTRAGSDVEEASLRRRQRGEFARLSPRVQGHPVAPLPAGEGSEFAIVDRRSAIVDSRDRALSRRWTMDDGRSMVIWQSAPAEANTRETVRCGRRPGDRRRVRRRDSRDRNARRARATDPA